VNELKVSIIVPVYKVEKYIVRCIESLVYQTYTNLEVILVDDGSPDSCGQICESYANKDNRIVVVHKPNGGLSDARNYGLSKATGEIIGFVDSDDYVDSKFVQALIEAMIQEKADIVECHSVNFLDGEEPQSKHLKDRKVINSFDWLTESKLGDFMSCVVWNKLYRRELFKNVSFPVGRHYEDEATTYKVVYKSKKIVRLSSALYFYRQRSGSITRMKKTMKEINEQYLALFEKCLFFNQLKENVIADFAYSKLLIYMISTYKVRFKLCGQKSDWYDSIVKNSERVLSAKIVPVKYKMYIRLFICMPTLFLIK
jgi:glycosyltransferase involved in cell wall biosynthesis